MIRRTMKDQNYSCYNSEFHATHNHQVTNSIILTTQYPWHLFTRKANKTGTGSEKINDNSGKLAELTQYASSQIQAISKIRHSAKR